MAKKSTVELAEAEQKFVGQLARALWDVDVKDTDFGGIEARNAAFTETRGTYVNRATQVVILLKKRGAELPAS